MIWSNSPFLPRLDVHLDQRVLRSMAASGLMSHTLMT